LLVTKLALFLDDGELRPLPLPAGEWVSTPIPAGGFGGVPPLLQTDSGIFVWREERWDQLSDRSLHILWVADDGRIFCAVPEHAGRDGKIWELTLDGQLGIRPGPSGGVLMQGVGGSEALLLDDVGGVWHRAGSNWNRLATPHGILEQMSSLVRDAQGNLWIATEEGVYLYRNRRRWEPVGADALAPGARVNVLARTRCCSCRRPGRSFSPCRCCCSCWDTPMQSGSLHSAITGCRRH
jgi:hypothetical protein